MAVIKDDELKVKACIEAGCTSFYNKRQIPNYCGKGKDYIVKFDYCPLWKTPLTNK